MDEQIPDYYDDDVQAQGEDYAAAAKDAIAAHYYRKDRRLRTHVLIDGQWVPKGQDQEDA